MTEAELPMPLPLLLGLVSLATAVFTAIIAALSKKWRTPADDREDRRIGIEADERLLARFEKLLEERDKRIDGLVAEVKEVRAIAEKAANANRILTDWIYAAVRVVRELGGIDMLPDPPEGVVIADHPSHRVKN
ncbi:hypothetical protein [Pseudarthrobacter sp. NIBRBAC000502770]|uniref:hypothetical protein n=1 Tax=Pseudarthrobacter sp. NIBRBAC000502770 TaxID=2590785 RepID=UPI001140716B|nr:hypothetical protein [Pseudarthrobacter sp. NIBRBAC000502770]QDG90694.1 hypothetical protein NIBR502770_20950 [Pseudarthrobacter sp. NIBRBAC000502770]